MHSTRGITRPSAVHLTLPLVERHSHAFGGASSDDNVEENLLTVLNSRWTVSAGPKSSSSMYSQDSYTFSPPVFSERKVDRRRFAIAISPSQEAPWLQQGPSFKTPSFHEIFVVNLRSKTAELTTNEASRIKSIEAVVVGEKITEKIVEEKNAKGKMAKDSGNAKANMKKLRMSSKVLGRMITRLSAHQASRHGSKEPPPLASGPAPQILISLPSPGLNFSLQERISTPKSGSQNHSFMPRSRATLPSTWKPHRPPSPLPKMLRKKHKGTSSSLSHLVVASPPPPLPTRANYLAPPATSHIPENRHTTFANFSTPLCSPTGFTQAVHNSPWADLQMRLQARAKKSAPYAIHDGGIISPTSS